MGAMEKAIESAISEETGSEFRIADARVLGGGCIHQAQCLNGTDGRQFFLKQNQVRHMGAFQAEAAALGSMAATGTIRVPRPVAVRECRETAFLVLEYLPFGRSGGDWARMGAELARLHQTESTRFGWDHDNWIGSTPQVNAWKNDWVTFYAECRLRPQLDRAAGKGLRVGQADVLIRQLHLFFEDYTPTPSLLHGDLWAGNAAFLEDGTPVIFDPASYYGDPETDLAMTELFGGFPDSFYQGYASVRPIHHGYNRRRDLYQLYHVLNHYTIFGGGYGAQAKLLTDRLVDSV